MGSQLAFAENDNCESKYINELIVTRDYFRALSEIKKTEFKNRNNKIGFNCARYELGLYLKTQEYDLVNDILKKLNKYYFLDTSEYYSELNYLTENYSEVIKLTNREQEELKSFSLRLQNPYDNLKTDCITDACLELTKLDNKNYKKKSESLALLFGIVPGGGQLYAGYFWGGLSSFLVNGLLIGTSVMAFNNNENVLGLASGILSVGFYMGNIYAGYEATKRYNDLKEEQYKNKIKNINFRLKLFELAL